MKIGILGGGSWGSAMANSLAKNHDVVIYAREDHICKEINENHTNNKYLKDRTLRNNIFASTDISEALKNQIILNAVPTQNIRNLLENNYKYFNKDSIIINLSKGIEKETNLRISEIYKEFLPHNKFLALSGPSHAEEVIIDSPTSLVIAGTDPDLAKKMQKILMSDSLRIYTNDDLLGVEYGGAVKNVLALGIGMIDGLGFGDNPKAALITRGIHEMARFCMAMGGQRNTLYGLAGLGDLIVTATSKHSRNRNAGELIGKGYSILDSENKINMVVEGISTAKAIKEISDQKRIYMPISSIIYDILYKGFDIREASKLLMNKLEKEEFDF